MSPASFRHLQLSSGLTGHCSCRSLPVHSDPTWITLQEGVIGAIQELDGQRLGMTVEGCLPTMVEPDAPTLLHQIQPSQGSCFCMTSSRPFRFRPSGWTLAVLHCRLTHGRLQCHDFPLFSPLRSCFSNVCGRGCDPGDPSSASSALSVTLGCPYHCQGVVGDRFCQGEIGGDPRECQYMLFDPGSLGHWVTRTLCLQLRIVRCLPLSTFFNSNVL